MASLVFAACSDSPPILPNSFSGTATTQTSASATITNVSVGDVIKGYIDYASDTTADGTFTVTTAGQYELGVSGCSGDNGKTINFTINGITANLSSTFSSSGPAPRTVNLNAIGVVSSGSSGGSSGGGGGGGGGGGASVSPVTTPSSGAGGLVPVPSIPRIPSTPAAETPSASAESQAQAAEAGGASGREATPQPAARETQQGSTEQNKQVLSVGQRISNFFNRLTRSSKGGDRAGRAFGLLGTGSSAGPLIILILILVIVLAIVAYKIKTRGKKEEDDVLYTSDVQRSKAKKK